MQSEVGGAMPLRRMLRIPKYSPGKALSSMVERCMFCVFPEARECLKIAQNLAERRVLGGAFSA